MADRKVPSRDELQPFFSQLHELEKQALNGSLDLGQVHPALQDIIEGKFSTPELAQGMSVLGPAQLVKAWGQKTILWLETMFWLLVAPLMRADGPGRVGLGVGFYLNDVKDKSTGADDQPYFLLKAGNTPYVRHWRIPDVQPGVYKLVGEVWGAGSIGEGETLGDHSCESRIHVVSTGG